MFLAKISANTALACLLFSLIPQPPRAFSKPAIKSCVIESAHAGDPSEILNIKTQLLTLKFTEPVHKIHYNAELYLPGVKTPELLIHAGSVAEDKSVTWAQLSIQWADGGYLRINNVDQNSNLLHMELKTQLSSGGSAATVPKNKIDVFQSEATGGSFHYPPDARSIPLFVEICSPSHDIELTSTLEDTIKANPTAAIIVYTIELN